MEEKNNWANLAKMCEEFNNKTFIYRINGFAHACKINNIEIPTNLVLNGGKVVPGNVGVLFNTKKSKQAGNETDYFISANSNTYPTGKTITLSGQYGDLTFSFINYYDKERLDKKIVDLPFAIYLEKKIDKYTYKFDIETVDGPKTKFTIIKYRELKDRTLYDDVTFYANVFDFSKILKLVKSFVYNPILVFNTYNEINQKYQHVYTNSELSKGIMQDESLDKPVGKIKKIVKRIINNN